MQPHSSSQFPGGSQMMPTNSMLANGNNNIPVSQTNNIKLPPLIKDGERQQIWEKKTASSQHPLQRFHHYETEVDDKYVPITTYTNKEKKLIEQALEVVQQRKKNRDLAPKPEKLVDMLEQKKQMFLVTMTHQIIGQEISTLRQEAENREKALKEANQFLEEDYKSFEKYQEKYKSDTKKNEETVEKKVQNRLIKEQEIKSKQITANSLRAEKSKNQQTISSYLKYKRFLDQLPPKEWVEDKAAVKQAKLRAVKLKLKPAWMEEHGRRSGTMDDEYNKYFDQLVQSGENQEIEEILNNDEMFFKEPSELIEYFNNLEENNLFCIQNAQYAEQTCQELKVRSEEKRRELTERHEQLKEHKRALDRQYIELDYSIKQLRRKKETSFSASDESDNRDIKATIAQQYQLIKDTMHMSSFMPQIESNALTLELLSCIEICMEKLWQRLRECYAENPKLMKDIKTQHEKKKNNDKREEATKNNKIEEEKRKIRNLEKKQPTLRANGRIDMRRSAPEDKVVTKQVEVSGKDMDDDRKYLVE